MVSSFLRCCCCCCCRTMSSSVSLYHWSSSAIATVVVTMRHANLSLVSLPLATLVVADHRCVCPNSPGFHMVSCTACMESSYCGSIFHRSPGDADRPYDDVSCPPVVTAACVNETLFAARFASSSCVDVLSDFLIKMSNVADSLSMLVVPVFFRRTRCLTGAS
jgi:hypothetical protein